MNVLLVDDEALLAKLMREILVRAGWAVTIAHSLTEAKSQAGPFDLVIADVRLPNGDGRHLRSLYPKTRFITISGFPHEEVDLQKPFTPDQLRGKVREVMSHDADPTAPV